MNEGKGKRGDRDGGDSGGDAHGLGRVVPISERSGHAYTDESNRDAFSNPYTDQYLPDFIPFPYTGGESVSDRIKRKPFPDPARDGDDSPYAHSADESGHDTPADADHPQSD